MKKYIDKEGKFYNENEVILKDEDHPGCQFYGLVTKESVLETNCADHWIKVEEIEEVKDTGRTIRLKTWPEYFQAILEGKKKFEFRKNDKGFRVGDVLWLDEYDNEEKDYTGRMCYRKITYILKDNPFFNLDDYVILSITDNLD